MSCSAAAPVSVARSTVFCGPCQARADDREQVRVSVLLRDAAGRPVRGARVLFVEMDSALTDDQGEASAIFASRAPGRREVQVRLPDGTPLGSAAVEFFAGSFPRLHPEIKTRMPLR